MTPAEQRLTDHLATVVCGWHRSEIWRSVLTGWLNTAEQLVRRCDRFDPIHRPDDCDLVMEAWRQGEHTMLLDLDNASRKYTATADYGEPNAGASDPSESWLKAVCEAIADASGYDGEGK